MTEATLDRDDLAVAFRRAYSASSSGSGLPDAGAAALMHRPRLRAWDTIIHDKLEAWLYDKSPLDDGDSILPDDAILRLSLDVAEKMRDDGNAPPQNVYADPNGGIVFEKCANGAIERIRIWDDATIEWMKIIGAEVVERAPFFG